MTFLAEVHDIHRLGEKRARHVSYGTSFSCVAYRCNKESTVESAATVEPLHPDQHQSVQICRGEKSGSRYSKFQAPYNSCHAAPTSVPVITNWFQRSQLKHGFKLASLKLSLMTATQCSDFQECSADVHELSATLDTNKGQADSGTCYKCTAISISPFTCCSGLGGVRQPCSWVCVGT